MDWSQRMFVIAVAVLVILAFVLSVLGLLIGIRGAWGVLFS